MNDRAVAAHDDLGDSSAQNPLARCSRRGGMQPGALEIDTEREELLPLRLTKRRRTPRHHGRDVAFDLGNRLQSLVPSAFQLPGDEPIGWINSIVLPTGMDNLIAGLLQGEFQLPLSRRGLWASIALTAASIPSGFSTRSTSLAIAASMLRPLTEMHRSVPWLMHAP